MERQIKRDYKGEIFGDLTALRVHPERRKKLVQYVFLCKCGNEIVQPIAYLMKNNRTDCGCKTKAHVVPSEELKLQIIEEAKLLTGTMTARSTVLNKKYKLSARYIRGIIRDELGRVKKMANDADKARVKVLFDQDAGENETQKCKSVSAQTGFSVATIRLIVRAKEKENTKIKYFDPKMEMF